ncbi:unnamed protein product [Clavelina lepadiformis]|uniref:GPI transamidase component PIG-T n=1 Tax=Clavelina lepadiformis TaxID=159417 RepID=A0ABP0GZ84_CLALP
MQKNMLGLFVLIYFAMFCTCNGNENYEESLKLDMIDPELVYGFFNFTTTWNYEHWFAPRHYKLFPRSLGQLIQKYNIAELHFTMTQGLWRYKRWGFPDASSPTGAQLWVWFHKNTEDVDKNWVGFTNALSGLFCASLNFINKAVTVTPKISFRPVGVVEGGETDNTFLRYGTLSRENLCTENLTPWMKLLPCGSKAGPGALLNPSQLHHSKFLSIGLHFLHDCSEGGSCERRHVKLEQHISVVYDLRTLNLMPNFSLLSLFKKRVKPACPLSSRSVLMVRVIEGATISPALTESVGGFSVLNLHRLKSDSNVQVKGLKTPGVTTKLNHGVTNHCYLTGIGLEGGFVCSIVNHNNREIPIIFFQVVPWFLHTQVHTLKVVSRQNDIISPAWISYTPGKIRESPNIMELIVRLPSDSITELSFHFTKGFMTWIEHPPDANHGFYISPAVITTKTNDLNISKELHGSVQHIYSEAILVNIPVPDFSMPYNVICLVCTVLAISFGSFHNLATRRFHKLSPNEVSPVKKKFLSLIERFKSRKKKNVDESLASTAEKSS